MTSIAPGVEQASAARGRSYAPHLRFAGYGLLLGFCLSRMGFSSYDELHRMFVFADLRLFWTFIGGTGLCMLGYALLFRRNARPRKSIHRGAVVGGLLFGIGWAVSGACPGVAMVQLGEGQLPAVATTLGIFFGAWLYPHLQRRLGWDTGSCEV